MTKFTTKGDVTWGFGSGFRSATIMAENQAGWDAYANTIGNALWFATMSLKEVIAHLNGGGSAMATHFADKFFQTGEVLSASDRSTIASVLVLTLSGINNHMAVKVGDKKDVDAWAWVHNTPREPKQPWHNKIGKLNDFSNMKRAGAVHLSAKAAQADLAKIKRTLVHEASHKYAGTIDYCYFKDDHPYAIKDNGVMTRLEALMNADSYAFFAQLPHLSAERAALEGVHNPFA